MTTYTVTVRIVNANTNAYEVATYAIKAVSEIEKVYRVAGIHIQVKGA